MTHTKRLKCMNCGNEGMLWNFHHTICTSEPEPPEADFWRGKCSDCGFTAQVENDDPDTTIGKWQTRNQLFAFRERKNQVVKRKHEPRKPRGGGVDTAGMDENELKKVLGF